MTPDMTHDATGSDRRSAGDGRRRSSVLPMRWLGGAALVLAGLGALFLAGGMERTGPYIAALVLFAFCALGVFALISTAWGGSRVTRLDPLPANGAVRWAVGGVVGALGLVALMRAGAAVAGSADYYHGLALFAVAVALDFLLLKDWFDRTTSHRRG